MQNGNSVAAIANQVVATLGCLTPGNFQRAKAAADSLVRQEIRIAAYLAIARQAVMPEQREVRGMPRRR